WVHMCTASNVSVKQALWEAGYPLAHLSRPSHPFSTRPFSLRFIDPFLRRPELAFLAERVIIEDGHTVAPLRRLRRLLGENRVVSISATPSSSTTTEFPLLGG